MTAERDDEKFAQLADAIGPYLDRVVIVGGWAHRLFRLHPLAQTLPYAPLMTRDTDVALPTGITVGQESLRERLLSRGFHEQLRIRSATSCRSSWSAANGSRPSVPRTCCTFTTPWSCSAGRRAV